MKCKIAVIFLLTGVALHGASAQSFARGDRWYSNPLGFSPLELHASNGFLIPAVAVAACLLLANDSSSLTRRISIYNEDGISWGYKFPYTTLSQNNTGFTYYLRKWLNVGLELSLYFPRDSYNSTLGIGARPFARFYPINGRKWRLYFESGGGIIYFLDNFPKSTDEDSRTGTRWNGTTKYGIGADIDFGDAASFHFGVRHIHVSNGNIEGVERNPSHDSNGLFVGFTVGLE